MKNVKTTIFGLLAAIGGYFAQTPGKLQSAGQLVATISTFLLGASASDAKKD